MVLLQHSGKIMMADSTWWWLAAGSLIAVELVTGTFYLLMVSVGLCAAALAAHAGLPVTWQWAIAAVMGGGTVSAWRSYRRTQPPPAPAQANQDVNMDVGAIVQVDHWQANNTCRVKYRGALWDAALQHGSKDQVAPSGQYVVAEVIGNRLMLKPSSLS
jgi:membrane protein implicated in regulation of membrane protease activity